MAGVLDRGCKLAVTYCFEAGFNLLERQACNHVRALAELGTLFGADIHQNPNTTARVAARRVLWEYWVAHGHATVLRDSVTRIEGVSSFFFPPRDLFLSS